MDDDAPPEPARSAGGSNVSSLQPQPAEADEDDVISGASEESDGRAMAVEVEQPVMQAHHVRVAAPASEAAGHSVFQEPRRRAHGMTGSTSTVHRPGLSNVDSTAQQALSFEGPASAAHPGRGVRQGSEEVHMEVAGPMRVASRSVSQSMSGGGSVELPEGQRRRAEDDDHHSAEQPLPTSSAGDAGRGADEVNGAHAAQSGGVGVVNVSRGEEEEVEGQCGFETDAGGSVADPGEAAEAAAAAARVAAEAAAEVAVAESKHRAEGSTRNPSGFGAGNKRPRGLSEPRPVPSANHSGHVGGHVVGGHVVGANSSPTRRTRGRRGPARPTDDETSIGNSKELREGAGASSPASTHGMPREPSPQIAEASHLGVPKHLPPGAAPSLPDERAWFERERWELQLHDCLRAAEKHKLDGKSLFEQQDFQGADEKYLKALKYVEFENVFEGDDVPLARKLKVHALLNSAACKLLMGIAVREAVDLCTRAVEVEGDGAAAAKALYWRAYAHVAAADLPRGLADLEKCLQLQPAHRGMQDALGELRRGESVRGGGNARGGDGSGEAEDAAAACERIFDLSQLLQELGAGEAPLLFSGTAAVEQARPAEAEAGRHAMLAKRTASEDVTVETHRPGRRASVCTSQEVSVRVKGPMGRRAHGLGNGGPSRVKRNATGNASSSYLNDVGNGRGHGGVPRSHSGDVAQLVGGGVGDGLSEEEGEEFVSPALVLPAVLPTVSSGSADPAGGFRSD